MSNRACLRQALLAEKAYSGAAAVPSVYLLGELYRRQGDCVRAKTWLTLAGLAGVTLLALLLATGIKKSECLGIHINHIDLQSPGEPYVFIRYASPANRYKERKLTLPEDWIPAYEEYLTQYNPVDRLLPWSPRRLEYLLEDIGKDAGLSKHLSFDMCRWTCALQDHLNNVEPEKIRQKLGISKIQWREINVKLRQLAGMTE